jgi:dsRNA-specific ribonuclease
MNSDQNYESLETLGDTFLSKAFFVYFRGKYPDLTDKQYTDLKTKYMSKSYQKKLSQILGFGKYLRIDSLLTLTIGMLEDVFESFVGALYLVSEMVMNIRKNIDPKSSVPTGNGDLAVYQFIEYLFRNVKINPHRIEENEHTLVKNIFTQMNWTYNVSGEKVKDYERISMSIEDDIKNYQYQIVFTPQAIDYFITHKNLKYQTGTDVVIGEASHFSKKEAAKYAYRDALDTLISYGITPEFARQFKESTREIKDYNLALLKAQKMGYNSINVMSPKSSKGAKGSLLLLVGTRMIPISSPLTSGRVDNEYREQQDILYKKYATGTGTDNKKTAAATEALIAEFLALP